MKIIRMLSAAAGPDGAYAKGAFYAAPGNMTLARAEAFVAGGAAEWVESVPADATLANTGG
jgi:hypothetical protein